jgi:arylsulfatase A-like enzyme
LPDTKETRADIAALALNIARLDGLVGTAVEALERASLLDGTIVVFTTDHGIAVGRAKHTLYDPGVRTSFILRAPGLVQSGLRPDCLVSNLDVYPTLCELAGVQVPGALDGVSFAAVFTDPDFRGRESVFSSFTYGQRSGMQYYAPARSLCSRRFKYIRNFTDIPYYLDTDWLARFFRDRSAILSHPQYGKASLPEELYDLPADPGERCNLLADPRSLSADASAALMRMRADMLRILGEGGDEILDGPVGSKKDSPLVQQWVRPEGKKDYVLRYDMFSETAERPFP